MAVSRTNLWAGIGSLAVLAGIGVFFSTQNASITGQGGGSDEGEGGTDSEVLYEGVIEFAMSAGDRADEDALSLLTLTGTSGISHAMENGIISASLGATLLADIQGRIEADTFSLESRLSAANTAYYVINLSAEQAAEVRFGPANISPLDLGIDFENGEGAPAASFSKTVNGVTYNYEQTENDGARSDSSWCQGSWDGIITKEKTWEEGSCFSVDADALHVDGGLCMGIWDDDDCPDTPCTAPADYEVPADIHDGTTATGVNISAEWRFGTDCGWNGIIPWATVWAVVDRVTLTGDFFASYWLWADWNGSADNKSFDYDMGRLSLGNIHIVGVDGIAEIKLRFYLSPEVDGGVVWDAEGKYEYTRYWGGGFVYECVPNSGCGWEVEPWWAEGQHGPVYELHAAAGLSASLYLPLETEVFLNLSGALNTLGLDDQVVASASVGPEFSFWADGYLNIDSDGGCGDQDDNGIDEAVEITMLDVSGQTRFLYAYSMGGNGASGELFNTERQELFYTDLVSVVSSSASDLYMILGGGSEDRDCPYLLAARPCYADWVDGRWDYMDDLGAVLEINWGDNTGWQEVAILNTDDDLVESHRLYHEYEEPGSYPIQTRLSGDGIISDVNTIRTLVVSTYGGCEPAGCPDLGDLNGDGGWNVLDIVALANCVLAQDCGPNPLNMEGPFIENGCAGDLNGDGGYNVLDIVILANCVLANNCSG